MNVHYSNDVFQCAVRLREYMISDSYVKLDGVSHLRVTCVHLKTQNDANWSMPRYILTHLRFDG